MACALYREPKSTIFVLQSSTRCLRAIGDNSTVARIFLSKDNYKVLDKELKNNFDTSVAELSAQDQKAIDHELKVERRKKVKVKKVLKEMAAAEAVDIEGIKLDFGKFKSSEYVSFVGEGGILVNDDGRAGYTEARANRRVEDTQNLTFYEMVEVINRHTHLSCSAIADIIERSGKTRSEFVQQANESPALIPFLVQEVLEKAYHYEWREETIEEELELTKLYPFKITVQHDRNILVVYKEQEEQDGHKSRIGFHINPYNFDSSDEKDLFRYLRDYLKEDEAVVDVYFTGGVIDAIHNDFYFEYWNPERQCYARYFPDFLVETTQGRYLIIEVKSNAERMDYEANAKTYTGKVEELTNEVFAKQVGFEEFQKTNKNFEYRIIFNAGIQAEQARLLEEVRSL